MKALFVPCSLNIQLQMNLKHVKNNVAQWLAANQILIITLVRFFSNVALLAIRAIFQETRPLPVFKSPLLTKERESQSC